jgi:hypothetical protein
LIYYADIDLHFISKSETFGDEYCRVFCPGKLTVAENLHVVMDSQKVFPCLQHHIISQEVRWCRISVVNPDLH